MFMSIRASTSVTQRTLVSPRARLGLVVVFSLGALGLFPAPVLARAEPVLLVHGYRGSASSFNTMRARFEANGRTAVAISLPSQDNAVNARAIRDFITSRGWTRVDIVAHSMGGLSSRQFVKFLGGTATVDAYVSLGSPQYGILVACALPSWYGGQMCPSSSFLRDLNAGDDTPGAPAYATLYSTGDTYVPNSSSRLDGGACFIRVSGVSHSGLLTDANVYRLARQATNRGCPGTFMP
jgi:triacylglycerol esterase/lipase EstA (alpha/beta hydrolase family)